MIQIEEDKLRKIITETIAEILINWSDTSSWHAYEVASEYVGIILSQISNNSSTENTAVT